MDAEVEAVGLSGRESRAAPIPVLANRILLRPFVPADAEALFEAVDESRVELAEWLDWCRDGYSLSDAIDYVERGRVQDGPPTTMNFAVFARSGREGLVGTVGLSGIDQGASTANLGYWIRTSMTGHGYAREAVEALARHARANLRLERLEIAIHPSNLRSQAVARSLGARDEGVAEGRILHGGQRVEARLFSL
jgi:RimJ/RimL family protein N-acetyltransferase